VLLLPPCGFPASFPPVYHALKTTTMSGTAEVVTLQNPRTDGKPIAIDGIYVLCSAACNFQVEMDGTAATGTNLARIPATKILNTSRGVAFSASTSITPRFVIGYSVPAGAQPYPIEFDSDYQLPGNGTNSNFTVRMLTNTGTVTIFLKWREP